MRIHEALEAIMAVSIVALRSRENYDSVMRAVARSGRDADRSTVRANEWERREPLHGESVTHVSGINRHLCDRNRPQGDVMGLVGF